MLDEKKTYSLGRLIATAVVTFLVTSSLAVLIAVGADRQKLFDTKEKLEKHIEASDEKIRELNVLKESQAANTEHLKNIDNTLTEIKGELQRMRGR